MCSTKHSENVKLLRVITESRLTLCGIDACVVVSDLSRVSYSSASLFCSVCSVLFLFILLLYYLLYATSRGE